MRFTLFKFPIFNPQPDVVQITVGLVAVSATCFWLWGA